MYARNIAMECRERQYSVEKVELIMVRQELQSLSTVCRAWTLERGDINDILASQQVKSSSIAYHTPMSNVKASWRVLFNRFTISGISIPYPLLISPPPPNSHCPTNSIKARSSV